MIHYPFSTSEERRQDTVEKLAREAGVQATKAAARAMRCSLQKDDEEIQGEGLASFRARCERGIRVLGGQVTDDVVRLEEVYGGHYMLQYRAAMIVFKAQKGE